MYLMVNIKQVERPMYSFIASIFLYSFALVYFKLSFSKRFAKP
jgi:hypothetical protein